MSLRLLKECTKCGKTQPRKWSEDADFVCLECKQKTMTETAAARRQAKVLQAPRSMANKSHNERHMAAIEKALAEQPPMPERKTERQKMEARVSNALRSDPTRRAMHRSGDDLDPLNPLSLTSPLNPIYHTSDRADWDSSSHRNHSSSASSTCDDDSSRHTSHSSHSWSGDSGSSYDSGSSDSGSSSSGGCD